MVKNATHHLTAHFGHKQGPRRHPSPIFPGISTGRPPKVVNTLLFFHSRLRPDGDRRQALSSAGPFTKISEKSSAWRCFRSRSVPALIPTFIRSFLRSEEESWLVRGLILIYKPLFTWPAKFRGVEAPPRSKISGAGLFPLQAVFGISWRTGVLGVVAAMTAMAALSRSAGGRDPAFLRSRPWGLQRQPYDFP